jgi:hypothetical protein
VSDRLVQQLQDGTLLTDLSPVSFSPWYLLRDSFSYQPAAKTRIAVPQPAPRGGSQVVYEHPENGTLAAVWVVVGTSADDCWHNAETLIGCFERAAGVVAAGLQALQLKWTPDGVGHSWMFDQQGSADWSQSYSWTALVGGFALQLPASWQVLPR